MLHQHIALDIFRHFNYFVRSGSVASIIKRNRKNQKAKETNSATASEHGWIDALKKPELIESCVKFGLKKSLSMKMMRSKLKEIYSYQERIEYSTNHKQGPSTRYLLLFSFGKYRCSLFGVNSNLER